MYKIYDDWPNLAKKAYASDLEPANFENIEVPSILLSGDKAKIENWREKKALERTKKIRPNFLSD